MQGELKVPSVFTIHVGTGLGPEWTEWLEGAEVRPFGNGTTMVTAAVRDQSMLLGLLSHIGDLGIPLLGLYPASEYTPVHKTAFGNARTHEPKEIVR